MKIAIMQPTYWPWIGYFELVAQSSVFVFLDSAQFVKGSWHSRNRLKGNNDQPFWLSVPVQSAPLKTPLSEVRIAPQNLNWRKDHQNSILTHLGSAPFYAQLKPVVDRVLSSPYERLTELTVASVRAIAELIGVDSTFALASELGCVGKKSTLLIDICQRFNATRYYSPAGSADYMEAETGLWDAAGISVDFQDWRHPVYPQRGTAFVSHLSVLDAIANVGAAQVGEWVKRKRI